MDLEGLLTGGPGLGTFVLLMALGLLPFVFMVTTSYAKMVVVLSLLRNALGTGGVPSGLLVSALALSLSLFVMMPVGEAMWARAEPVLAEPAEKGDALTASGALRYLDAASEAAVPLRDFLRRHSNESELSLFEELGARSGGEATRDELRVLIPAFLLSELAEAFKMGFLLFIPFLVVDMVIANVLLALGMHMLSPTTVSLPFKLLLFVAADGLTLLAKALVLGYA
jgi:type III secretion protein R